MALFYAEFASADGVTIDSGEFDLDPGTAEASLWDEASDETGTISVWSHGEHGWEFWADLDAAEA